MQQYTGTNRPLTVASGCDKNVTSSDASAPERTNPNNDDDNKVDNNIKNTDKAIEDVLPVVTYHFGKARSTEDQDTTPYCVVEQPSSLEQVSDAPMDFVPVSVPNYAECIRLLTRQLLRGQVTSVDGDTSENDGVGKSEPLKQNNRNQDWQDDAFVHASSGCHDLLALHNAVSQCRHAWTLSQLEAASALEDAAAARQAVMAWRRQAHAANDRLTQLEISHNEILSQRDRLLAEKRVLKTAYKELTHHQFSHQTQQVEQYVVNSLTVHEQSLQKNRSRTTTETTFASCSGGGDSDIVESSNNEHKKENDSNNLNNCIREQMPSIGGISSGNFTADELSVLTTTPKSNEPAVSKKPTDEDVIIPLIQPQPARSVGGFGACGAIGFGKTFNLKDKNKQDVVTVPVVSKAPSTSGKTVEPYAPVQLQPAVAPSGRSDDDGHATAGVGSKMKNYLLNNLQLGDGDGSESRSKRPAPLITLDDSLPCNVSFDPDDSEGSCLPSPLLFHGNGDTVSPSGSSNEQYLSWDNEGLSSCDPIVFRSLSIPVVHEGRMQPHSTSKILEIRARKFVK